jgi:two-component system KDP operon response regulator KdpE
MNSPVRILIVDDEDSIRRVLRVNLESRGFTVEEAGSAGEAMAGIEAYRPQLIILDLGLPDRPGSEILREIRNWSNVPILVLTVLDDERSKVDLLEAGADDYITKPFSMPELIARVHVALRHKQEDIEATPVFNSGPLSVDLARHELHVNGTRVHLTATEFNVLRVLVRGRGQVVSQDQILNEVWGPHAKENPHYLRIYIGQLRKKMEDDPSSPKHILTDPGMGYRII